MSEAGDGNIKVVVRCRPLNSRGAQPKFSLLQLRGVPILISFIQNWREARSHSFACPETKPSSIPRRPVLCRIRNALLRGRRWLLALTRATGLRDQETNQGTVRSKRYTMTWERNCWIMGFLDLMHVFWLVSNSLIEFYNGAKY